MALMQTPLFEITPVVVLVPQLEWSYQMELFVKEQAAKAANQMQLDERDFVGDALHALYEKVRENRLRDLGGVKRSVWNLARDRVKREAVRSKHGVTDYDVYDERAERLESAGCREELIVSLSQRFPWLMTVTGAVEFGVSMQTVAAAFEMDVTTFHARLEQEREALAAESSLG